MRSVLLTGAARGIGRATTDELVRRGWRVLAGVRREEDGAALRAAHGDAVAPVLLDVTDPDAIARLSAAVGPRLDAVVNNAGIAVSGPLEGLPLHRIREQLEVNVVGPIAVTQAVLPALRASHGRIVLLGSVSGRVAFPQLGAYGASKFALEAVADALRVEVAPFGVGVTLIQPGAIDTDIWEQAIGSIGLAEDEMDPELQRLYAPQTERTRGLIPWIRRGASTKEAVAAVIADALDAKRPPVRRMVGYDARGQVALRTLMPIRAWDALIARAMGARRRP